MGWNPLAVTANPHAAFHRRSNLTASAASVSEHECRVSQHDHRGHHLGRDRRAPTGLEQISEHLLTEQLAPVRGQEREHPTRGQQMPRHRLHVQDLALRISPSLHPPILPTQPARTRTDTAGFSGPS